MHVLNMLACPSGSVLAVSSVKDLPPLFPNDLAKNGRAAGCAQCLLYGREARFISFSCIKV